MKRINRLVFVILIAMNGCIEEKSIFHCEGIPDENQSFAYMHFLSPKEGFLFGTYRQFGDMSDSDLDDPSFIPRFTEEANIYRTVDSGRSWKKVDSCPGFSYSSIAASDRNDVYILKRDSSESNVSRVVKVSLPSVDKAESSEFEAISAVWVGGQDVMLSNNRGQLHIQRLGRDLSAQRVVSISKYVLKGELASDGKVWGIFADTQTTYFGSLGDDGRLNAIDLRFIPKTFVVLKNGSFLVAGVRKNSPSSVVLVTCTRDGVVSELAEFHDYSIVQGMHASEEVISVFLGNVDGPFTSYDLFYSRDEGISWNRMRLEEPHYIRPNYLIGDTLYAYSGGARMQRIVFPLADR